MQWKTDAYDDAAAAARVQGRPLRDDPAPRAAGPVRFALFVRRLFDNMSSISAIRAIGWAVAK
jgi:hypothetical protein